MLDEIFQSTDDKMQKSIESLKKELSKLRTGRAHAGLLDGIMVEYYGNPTQLSQVAQVVVSDSRTLTISPFEKHLVGLIDKAILKSGLGLNPVSVGQVIKVPLPPLTEETRLSLTKNMKAEVENARISIRNVRRDSNTQIKSLLKGKDITEDDERKAQDRVQKLTDKFVEKIESMSVAKEADLMQV